MTGIISQYAIVVAVIIVIIIITLVVVIIIIIVVIIIDIGLKTCILHWLHHVMVGPNWNLQISFPLQMLL